MASDLLAARAADIANIWTENLSEDKRIGEDRFILHRTDLAALVMGTMEIMLRRISEGLSNKGIQIGDHSTKHNSFDQEG